MCEAVSVCTEERSSSISDVFTLPGARLDRASREEKVLLAAFFLSPISPYLTIRGRFPS